MNIRLFSKKYAKRLIAAAAAASVAVSSVCFYALADDPVEYIMQDAGVYEYSENDALYAATHFHMFAQETLDIQTHCNGNFATGVLLSGTHFGNNQISSGKYHDGKEVSYLRRFTGIDANPSVSDLVFGKTVKAYLRDNGNALYFENDITDLPVADDYAGVSFLGNTGVGNATSSGVFDHIKQDKGDGYFIDLNAEFSKLSKLSGNIANKLDDTDSVTYTVIDGNKGIIKVAPEYSDKLNVFTIKTSELTQAHGLVTVTGLDPLNDGALVINLVIDGGDLSAITELNFNFKHSDEYIAAHQNDPGFNAYYDGTGEDKGEFTDRCNVIWNLLDVATYYPVYPWETQYDYYVPYTGEVHLDFWSGIVLAPQADLVLDGSNFDGNAIAKTIKTGGESHRWDFGGSLPKFSDDNKVSFSFRKVDAETGNVIKNTSAKFKLTGPNGYQQTVTANIYGIVEFTNLETPGWGVYSNDYTLTEIAPPDGYEKDNNSYTVSVTIGFDGAGWKTTVNQNFDGAVAPGALPQLKNTHKKMQVEVIKTFENKTDFTGDFLAQTLFSMYKSYDGKTLSEPVYENIPVVDVGGVLKATFGQFNTPDVEQTYYIKEVSAPDGYDATADIIECKAYANGSATYRIYGSGTAFSDTPLTILNKLHEDPVTSDPTSSDPTSSDPTSSDPTSSDPTSSDPTSSDPTSSDPTSSDPTSSDPTSSDPTSSDPTSSDPTSSDPTSSDPTSSDPTSSDPTSSDPTSSDPTSSDPTSSDPTSSDPTSSDPTSSDPTSDDPTSSDPTSDDPTSSDPMSSDPESDDPVSSDPESSDPVSSDPESSDPESGVTSGDSSDETDNDSDGKDSSDSDTTSDDSSVDEDSSDIDEPSDGSSDETDNDSDGKDSSDSDTTSDGSSVDEDSSDIDEPSDGSSDETDKDNGSKDETDTDGAHGEKPDETDTDSDNGENNVPTGGRVAGVSLLVVSGTVAVVSLIRRKDDSSED